MRREDLDGEPCDSSVCRAHGKSLPSSRAKRGDDFVRAEAHARGESHGELMENSTVLAIRQREPGWHWRYVSVELNCSLARHRVLPKPTPRVFGLCGRRLVESEKSSAFSSPGTADTKRVEMLKHRGDCVGQRAAANVLSGW